MEWEKIFLAGILEKYPLEIINKRHEIEGNVCACLWKQPDLYKDLKELVLEDFITIDGRFFYALGKQLFTMGYKVFDAITVTTFLNDKAELKEQFKTKNGYSFMTELVPIMNTDNIEIFYDSLVKNNILMRLHDKGFQVVKEMPKFEAMNSELVYQYFDYNLNDVFVKKQIGIKPVDLTGGYDDFLQECDGGKNLGISFGSGCPLLNYHFGGLHKRNILLHTAHSGVGKTSSAIVFYLLPLLEQGEKVVVLVNEQGESDWRSMLLPTIISNKLHYSGFNRQRMQYGHFSVEEWKMLDEAKQWLAQYKSQLLFVQLFDYSISTIKKIIHKFSKLGYGTFFYDTAKPEDESSDKAWAVFTENSKELFQIANTEDIILICTAQLSGMTIGQRYLNVGCLAKAKAIKEVASQIVMIRNLWEDEYTQENHDIRPYNMFRDEDTGRYTNTKQYFETDKNKQYAVIFVDKNRFGRDGFQLLYQKQLDFNTWHELGFCTSKQY